MQFDTPKPTILHLLHGSVNQTFTTSEILRNSSQCLFILTSENYGHYSLLSLKQGKKLEERIKSGDVRIIDLFSMGSPWLTEELPMTESLPRTWMETPGPTTSFSNLIDHIRTQLAIPHKTILIDDLLGLLLNVQMRCSNDREYSEQALILLKLLKEGQSIGSQLHIVASDCKGMEVYDRALGFLNKSADRVVHILPNSIIRMHIINLGSGHSKDVDGSIVTNEGRTLFKLEQATVKLMKDGS